MALIAGRFLVPESRDPEATPLDPLGAALSIGGLVALVKAIIEASANSWTDPVVLAAFSAAVVLLSGFL